MKKGKLIVIEGTDSSGKQTHTQNTLERLRSEGISCKTMRFPRYETPTGRIVGESYLGKNGKSWFKAANSVHPFIASLYYAADRFAAKDEIETILSIGTNLILDRYVEANMGHQGGKSAPEDLMHIISFIEQLEYGLLGLPKPDRIIFLHMPHKIGMILKGKTGGHRDSHENNPVHLMNAERAYLEICEKFSWTKISCAPNGLIDSLRTIEDIGQEVYDKVMETIQNP